jgi:hypothetical protein
LDKLAKAAAGFTILPAATTYVRSWSGLLIPELDIKAMIGRVYTLRSGQRNLERIDVYTDRDTAGKIQEMYECVMIPPEKTVLHSETHVIMIDLPDIVESFSWPVKP